MKNRISSSEEPERWSLKRALKEKAGWTDAQLAELDASADQEDRVELLMQVEEEFGIEIDD
jgi:acyl carrier protein